MLWNREGTLTRRQDTPTAYADIGITVIMPQSLFLRASFASAKLTFFEGWSVSEGLTWVIDSRYGLACQDGSK
jgi:hypothetical protein